MKRKVALLLVSALSFSLVFGACGKDENDSTTTETKSSSSSQTEKKSKQVKDIDLTITFQDKEYAGKYTGEANSKDVADGKGKFVYEADADGKYLTYEGEFEKGEITGAGTLDTNNYLIVFNSADPEVEDIERYGTYQGPVEDGIAEGEGVFTTVNSSGNKYTYTGEFKSGTFNGQGTRSFEDASLNIIPEEGTFVDGNFEPTYYELCRFIGRRSNPEHAITNFELKDGHKTALEEIAKVEDKAAYVEANADPAITYDVYKENPDAYAGKIVSWTLKTQPGGAVGTNYYQDNLGLVDIAGRDDSDQWIECFLTTAVDEAESVAATMPGYTSVTIYGYPLGYSSFEPIYHETGEYSGDNSPMACVMIFKYTIN